MFPSPNPSCGSPAEIWWAGWGKKGSFWVKLQAVTAQSNPQWQGAHLKKRSASPRLPWNVLLPTVTYFSKPFICPFERNSEEYEVQSGAKVGQVLAGGNWSKPASDFLRFGVNAAKHLPVSSAAIVKSSISSASQSSKMVLLHGWQMSLPWSKQVFLPVLPYPLAFSPTSSFTLALFLAD